MSKSDLARFHPTSVLETGYDIVFFWVARMILMTEYALKTVPFHKVYLHGLVRDAQGRKMSKSLGNTIDPLDVADKFGTDAVRLSLVVGTTPGNDVKLSEQKIEGYRNFVNKLWNISRFVSTSLTNSESDTNLRINESRIRKFVKDSKFVNLSLADKWILSRLQHVIRDVTDHIEHYRFSQAAEVLRAFTWDEFADWYIEVSKWQLSELSKISEIGEVSPVVRSVIRHRLGGVPPWRDNPQSDTIVVLNHVLTTLVKLWHPFTPFVTEAIWKQLDMYKSGTAGKSGLSGTNLLLVADWPKPEKRWLNPKAEKTFAQLQAIVREIRSARSDFSIPPTTVLEATWKAPKAFREHQSLIEYLSKIKMFVPEQRRRATEKTQLTIHPDSTDAEISLNLSHYINLDKERARLNKAITETEAHMAQLTAQLKNRDFLARAPKDIVSTKRADLASAAARRKKLNAQLGGLG